ncbi:MAG: type II secretion system protein [Candidatus Riflebacteria bacterium]|nr:type II secretion system protein [Candidatus Riflebacteria bacterium]
MKKLKSKSAVTLVELAIAMCIFSFVAAGSFRAFQLFTGKASRNLSQRLVLQMEARKAFLVLFHEIQGGIEIVYPQPGTTLPYFLYRDFVNNLQLIYLEKDPETTKSEKEDMFRVVQGIKDPATGQILKPKTIMKYVKTLNFTAHHNGGVVLTTSLKSANGKFSLINYVRLKNMAAE